MIGIRRAWRSLQDQIARDRQGREREGQLLELRLRAAALLDRLLQEPDDDVRCALAEYMSVLRSDDREARIAGLNQVLQICRNLERSRMRGDTR